MKKMLISIFLISLLLITVVGSVGSSRELVDNKKIDMPSIEQQDIDPIIRLPDLPEYWALIIAPSDPIIPFPEKAHSLKKALISTGWKQENIIMLLNDNATESNIIDALETIASNDAPFDTTFLYVCTHGGVGYFMTHDGYMDYSDLDDGLDNLDSQAVGIVIDACHSGSAIPYLEHNGRVILASSPADEMAGHTFGMAFILGLEEFADFSGVGNYNGVVSMEESFNYVVYEHPDWPYDIFQIKDDYTGEIHLTVQDWRDGRLDQITNYTFRTNFFEEIHRSESRMSEIAQSFQPDANVLTKVRLIITNNNATSPIVISIRENLTGPDLTSKMFFPEEIEINESSFLHRSYITFDFSDINVIPEETYYIVCRTTEADLNHYQAYGRTEDCYEKGMCYKRFGFEPDAPWTSIDDSDLFFATYGRNIGESLPPYVPKRPSGPVLGNISTNHSYYVSTEDVDGDNLYYMFDWGDGNTKEWIGPFKSGQIVFTSHSWNEKGTYLIKVKAKDERSAESDWSSILKITININDPPKIPFLDGPTACDVGIEYIYTAITTDPDGDQVYYIFDWGDGSTGDIEYFGPYDSGEEISVEHIWSDTGFYEVKVKAVDIYGGHSDFSQGLLVFVLEDFFVPEDEYPFGG